MAFNSTGQTITMPHDNIGEIAYAAPGNDKRIYYFESDDPTVIRCAPLNSTTAFTEDATLRITLSTQDRTSFTEVTGLSGDPSGDFLYAMVGDAGSRYIHKYRIGNTTIQEALRSLLWKFSIKSNCI